MGYHTNFYACDPTKQVEWAKEILSKYQKQLIHEFETIPDDKFFQDSYNDTKNELTEENYKKFHKNAKKYNWGKWFIDEEEAFYKKYWDPNFTWESEKQEWIDHLEKIKSTGLLDLKLDEDLSFDYVSFLIANWKLFSFLKDFDMNYECRDNKIYSGDILKRYYRVKGRYCQSMWFNSDNIIEMIEDYVDVTKTTKTGKHPKLKLTKEEKLEIENLFRDYPDSYCWII